MMSRQAAAQGDCFIPWRWQGPPWAIKQSGPWTITDSNGGAHLILWYFNRPYAHASEAMIEKIFNDQLQL